MFHGTRRKCQQCQLKRCFVMGMKNDYFVSEEEKQRRRKRLANKLHLSAVPLPSSEITLSPQLRSPSTQVVQKMSKEREQQMTIRT
jgi:hypothetical protein